MGSGTSEHTIKTNHSVNLDDVAITNNENRYYHRKKKEAIWTWTDRPEMNSDTVVQLSHVYDHINYHQLQGNDTNQEQCN